MYLLQLEARDLAMHSTQAALLLYGSAADSRQLDSAATTQVPEQIPSTEDKQQRQQPGYARNFRAIELRVHITH